MAQDIAENLNVILHHSEKKRFQQVAKVNSDVHQLFLQGRYILQKIEYKEIPQAINLFNRALEADPAYAPALAGKANCYNSLGYLNAIAPAEALEKAMPLLEKALLIDPNLAYGHTNLGWAMMWFKWDLKNAEKEFTIGNDIDPSDVQCIQGNLFLNIYNGNTDKADFWLEKGLAVSHNDMWIIHLQGILLFYENKVAESIALFKNCTTHQDHILTYARLGWIHNLNGEYEKAIAIIEEGLNKFNVKRPSVMAWLAIGYYLNDNKEKAMEIFRELENNIATGKPNHAFYTGVAYAFIGMTDDAFRLLNKSFELHDLDMLWLKVEPMLKSIRNEPRYTELLTKVGFD